MSQMILPISLTLPRQERDSPRLGHKQEGVTPPSSITVPILLIIFQPSSKYNSAPIFPSASGLHWLTFWRGYFNPLVCDISPVPGCSLVTLILPHL